VSQGAESTDITHHTDEELDGVTIHGSYNTRLRT